MKIFKVVKEHNYVQTRTFYVEFKLLKPFEKDIKSYTNFYLLEFDPCVSRKRYPSNSLGVISSLGRI